METQSNVIAAGVALTGFAVAVITGILAGNPPVLVLLTGIAALVVCHAVGSGVALAAGVVARERLESARLAQPVPDMTGEAEKKKM